VVGEDAVYLSIRLTFDEVLAAISMGLASAKADEDFEATIFKISLEGNESAAALFLDLAEKADDFSAMKEKFAGALRFEIGTVAVAVRGDVKGVEPGLAVFDFSVGVSEIATARAKGFNFRARKDDAGFDRLGYGEIVTGFPVLDFNRFQGA